MSYRWRIESETDSCGADVVWMSLRGAEGTRRATLVTKAETDAAREILSSGMLYISGPGLPLNTLFRTENCRRARIPGCMLITAVEAVDPLRCRENDILREMRSILDLRASENTPFPEKHETPRNEAS